MTALIQLEAIRVRRDERLVLNDVNFSLQQGQRLAIVGANGAGKTTLLRTLVGLEKIEQGRIYLFNKQCQREADFRLPRQRIGFLFQESDDQLFCPTVIEDVAFGPRNMGLSEQEARQRAEQTLKQLGVWHLAERFSHRLSGGEKRLVCLAGLMAMHPDVLLLDEPTNGVDAENLQRLTAALKHYLGAIVLVSHDALFIKEVSQQSLLLDSGQLKAISANSRLSEQAV